MQVDKKILNVFWGQAAIDRGIVHTWLVGSSRSSYEIAPKADWCSQEKAIEEAVAALRGVEGEVHIYSQVGRLEKVIKTSANVKRDK